MFIMNLLRLSCFLCVILIIPGGGVVRVVTVVTVATVVRVVRVVT